MEERLNGKNPQVPVYPLGDLGLSRDEVDKLRGRPGTADWRDKEIQLGRAPFDSKYCPVWNALFESFAPVERALAPVYKFLIRCRGPNKGSVPGSKAVYQMAFDAVSQTIALRVSPVGLEHVLRDYVEDVAPPVVLTITGRDEPVGESGQLKPYEAIAGMVFAIVTRASYGARLNWFQSLGWRKVSCALRGLVPNAQEDNKFPMDTRRGFRKIAEPKAFDSLHGLLPAQPDDTSRVWGVNSFAALPIFGGASHEDVAQHRGFRMPVSSRWGKGTHLGL